MWCTSPFVIQLFHGAGFEGDRHASLAQRHRPRHRFSLVLSILTSRVSLATTGGRHILRVCSEQAREIACPVGPTPTARGSHALLRKNFGQSCLLEKPRHRTALTASNNSFFPNSQALTNYGNG